MHDSLTPGRRGAPFSLLLFLLLFSCERVQVSRGGATPPELAQNKFHHFKNLLDLSLGDLGIGTSLVLKPGSSGTEGWVAFLVRVGSRGGDLKIIHFFLNDKEETQYELLPVGSGYRDSFKLLRHPATGQLHLVAAGELGGIYLLRQEGGEWKRFSLEEGIQVPFLDAAFDDRGGVHVAYIEGVNKDLRYLLWQDEAFILPVTTVDPGFEEGQAIPGGQLDKKVSLDLNLNNEPVVSYYDASGGFLRIARFQSATNQWVIRAVAGAVTGEVLRPDANGQATTRLPYIAIPSMVRVYKNFNPLPPTSYTLLTNRSLGIRGYDPNAEYEMDYLSPFSQNYGQWSSLKVRPDGAVEISYYDFALGLLGFVTNLNPEGGDEWIQELVDSGGTVGDMNALAYAPLFRQGGVQIGVYPVVAYYDGSNANLNFAYRYKGKWEVALVDALNWAGFTPSVAASEDGWVVVAYLVVDPVTLVSTLRIVRFVPIAP